MGPRYKFDRLEFAGSLGDLGTLLPLAIGMIVVNGLSPTGIFFTVGLYYILSGHFFRVTVPVQPMKIIGAYAIATGMSSASISASGLLMAAMLMFIGTTGSISLIGHYTPKSVVRGIQLSTGVLLMVEGIRFIVGTSKFQTLKQAAEPYLALQDAGGIPIGILIGTTAAALTFMTLNNRRLPAAILVVLGGMALGAILGTHEGFEYFTPGLYLPEVLPFGMPSGNEFSMALLILVLPQIPMTIGNAVIAYTDLSDHYFGDASSRVTPNNACISMALANLAVALLGGMPLCHGAGGLAAHYQFGARTAGSNLMIGTVFLAMALFLGHHALAIVYLLPISILGVLLFFAGSQLALTINDITQRKDLFVALIMLGVTLGINLAVGFVAGAATAWALRMRNR